jgi:hypothetical protein
MDNLAVVSVCFSCRRISEGVTPACNCRRPRSRSRSRSNQVNSTFHHPNRLDLQPASPQLFLLKKVIVAIPQNRVYYDVVITGCCYKTFKNQLIQRVAPSANRREITILYRVYNREFFTWTYLTDASDYKFFKKIYQRISSDEEIWMVICS